MGAILVIIGIIAIFIGGLGLLIKIFSESILWGIGSIIFPIASWIFVFMHWEEARGPFLLQMAGIGLVILGMVLSGGSPAHP